MVERKDGDSFRLGYGTIFRVSSFFRNRFDFSMFFSKVFFFYLCLLNGTSIGISLIIFFKYLLLVG